MKRKNLLLLALLGITVTGCGKGNNLLKFDSQLDALTQLKNGSIDAAIIDSVMAGYYTSKGDYKDSFTILSSIDLGNEQYGIAGRKGDVAFMNVINESLIELAKNDKLNDVSNYFGVTSSLAISKDTTYTSKETSDDSFNKIKESGKVVIGYTVFAPIAYTDTKESYGDNSFTGFDIELARLAISEINEKYQLSLNVEFQEINWDSKEVLLTNGTIDLIWNGLTITDERKDAMEISIPYLNNKQVAVVNKKDVEKYKTKEDLKKATIGFESGSAGEDSAKELLK